MEFQINENWNAYDIHFAMEFYDLNGSDKHEAPGLIEVNEEAKEQTKTAE